MSNFKIFKRLITFPIHRLPYYIAGVCAFLGISGIFLIIAILCFEDEAASAFLALGLIIGVVALVFLCNRNKVKYRAAKVSMITGALTTNTIPKKSYKQSLLDVDEHFKSASVFGVIKSAGVLGYYKFIRKLGKDEIVRRKSGDFIQDLKSTVIIMGGNSLPVIGDCILAWEFSHSGEDMNRTACDGIEAVFRSKWKILGRFISLALGSITAFVILVFAATMFCTFLVYEVFTGFSVWFYSVSERLGITEMMNYKATGDNPELDFTILVLVTLFILLISCFISFYTDIAMLRYFFKVTDANPPTGRLYERISDRIDKIIHINHELQDSFKEVDNNSLQG